VNSSLWLDATILRASPSALAKGASSPPAASRSRPGEAVVGLAAEEDRVGGAEGCVDGSAHLLVEVGEVPLVRRLDDAVERDE
jgi:hypothetical protein